MSAKVLRVLSVEDHPRNPGSSVVSFGDVQVVAMKIREDGSARPRYAVGDLVVFVSDASLVPEYLLRQGFWDDEKGKGILRGSKGDRVKAGNFQEVRSDGIHFPVEADGQGGGTVRNAAGESLSVREGEDVSEFLGVTEWQG